MAIFQGKAEVCHFAPSFLPGLPYIKFLNPGGSVKDRVALQSNCVHPQLSIHIS